MGAALVAKGSRLPACSVTGLWPAVVDSSRIVQNCPESIRPELTGITLALEGCPGEVDLNFEPLNVLNR